MTPLVCSICSLSFRSFNLVWQSHNPLNPVQACQNALVPPAVHLNLRWDCTPKFLGVTQDDAGLMSVMKKMSSRASRSSGPQVSSRCPRHCFMYHSSSNFLLKNSSDIQNLAVCERYIFRVWPFLGKMMGLMPNTSLLSFWLIWWMSFRKDPLHERCHLTTTIAGSRGWPGHRPCLWVSLDRDQKYIDLDLQTAVAIRNGKLEFADPEQEKKKKKKRMHCTG